jgi:hypothetical protein
VFDTRDVIIRQFGVKQRKYSENELLFYAVLTYVCTHSSRKVLGMLQYFRIAFTILKCLSPVILIIQNPVDFSKIREDEIGSEYSMHGSDEKCVQNFGQEA